MIASFDALAFRQLRTRRLRVLLTAFGIVLGVATVFAVLLLVGTIRHTFDDLITSAWGDTDLVLLPKGAGTIPDQAVQRARSTPGVDSANGMVGAIFTRVDSHGRAISGQKGVMWVAGMDPAAPPYDFRWVAGRDLGSGPELIIEKNWARDHNVWVGSTIPTVTPTGPLKLHVVGVFRFSSGLSFGGQGIAAMPIADARRVMNIPSGYMQVAIKTADRSAVPALQKRLQAALGPGVQVKTPSGVANDVSKQVQALNVVLYFFSGIALFVGGFLIMNSFNMTVLQRLRELGMLRSLGATRGMVVRHVLTEALAIGAIGSLLGLALGAGMSAGLIQLMKGLGIPVSDVQFSITAAVVAIVVGLLATAAGALRPALRAGRISPIRAVLGGAAERRKPSVRKALLGVALFLPGLLLGGKFWFGNASAGGGGLVAFVGIVGTMLMFVGIVLAGPFVITPLVRAFAWPLRRIAPTGGRLASDATRSNPARTAATAAALTIGLSVIVVNGAMSASFLGTISDQIDQAYARDFTVTPIGTTIERAVGQTMSPDVRRTIAAMPGAGVVTPLRVEAVQLPRSGTSQPGLVLGVDPAQYPKVDRSPMKGATREQAYAGIAAGGVIVNTGYATAAGLHTGDTLTVRGPAGTRRARVAGVLDSSTFPGQGMIGSLSTLQAVYGTHLDTQVLVKARSAADRGPLGRRIDAYLARSHPNLEASSTAQIKSRIKDEVNQQFNLFNAILAVAVIVSLLGVINTLAMSVIERTREIGVLRALGSSRWQVRLTMLDESLLITLAGALAGILIGTLIAVVWVSGLDSLLPGISFHFPVSSVVWVSVAAVVLGLLAAILPARRAARLKPVEALSYE